MYIWYICDFVVCSCQPQEVVVEEPVVIRDVFCGVDGTMFLTDVGSVFACGSNAENKLGLNNRQGFIMAMKNIFTKVLVLSSIQAQLNLKKTFKFLVFPLQIRFAKLIYF